MKKMLRILALTIVLATAISSVAFAAITDPVLPFEPTDDEIYYVVPKDNDVCTNRVHVYYTSDFDTSAVAANLQYFEQVYTVSGDVAVNSASHKRIRLTYSSNSFSGYVNGLNLVRKKDIFCISSTLAIYLKCDTSSGKLTDLRSGTYVRVISRINANWQKVVAYTTLNGYYKHSTGYIYNP